MNPLPILALLVLAACTDPSLTAQFAVGAGGVSIAPVASGTLGGATISVSP